MTQYERGGNFYDDADDRAPRCDHNVSVNEHCPVCDEDPIQRCPGPAGLWPCALEFGHGGDHVQIPEGM